MRGVDAANNRTYNLAHAQDGQPLECGLWLVIELLPARTGLARYLIGCYKTSATSRDENFRKFLFFFLTSVGVLSTPSCEELTFNQMEAPLRRLAEGLPISLWIFFRSRPPSVKFFDHLTARHVVTRYLAVEWSRHDRQQILQLSISSCLAPRLL